MGSTRLPGKLLKPLAGIPVIEHVVKRVQTATLVDQLMVVTSIDPNNLPLIHHVSGMGIPVFVGSEDDVLDRFWQAIRLTAADHVVRVTADCPLIDHDIIDRVVRSHLEHGHAYTGNVEPRTWPRGLDVEVATRDAFEAAWTEAKTNHDREHVTPFIRNNPDRFPSGNIASEVDLSAHRWTLDQEEDYRFLTAMYHHLESVEKPVGTRQILDLLTMHPELSAINAHLERITRADAAREDSE